MKRFFAIFLILALVLIVYIRIGVSKEDSLYKYHGCVSTLDKKPIKNATIYYQFKEEIITDIIDQNGCYLINSDNGSPLSAMVEKDGYEFYFSGDDLNHINPNNFIGWKVRSELIVYGKKVSFILMNDTDVIDLTSYINIKINLIKKNKLKVSLMGGSVLMSDANYPGFAPNTDYVESLVFDSSKGFEGKIYFKLLNPKKWGWLKFRYMPNTYKGQIFEVKEWVINASNGRWLMYPKSGA